MGRSLTVRCVRDCIPQGVAWLALLVFRGRETERTPNVAVFPEVHDQVVPRELGGDLELVVVDMFTEPDEPGNDHRRLPYAPRGHDRADTRVADDRTRLTAELENALVRHELDPGDARHVFPGLRVAVLDD